MPIVWTAQMQTGHHQIDEQHQELVAILNELEAAHMAGDRAENLDAIFLRLKAYVLFHFGTEETLMGHVLMPYAHKLEHLRQHQEFAHWLGGDDAICRDGVPAAVDYLKNWLVAHIQGTDRALVRELRRRGKG